MVTPFSRLRHSLVCEWCYNLGYHDFRKQSFICAWRHRRFVIGFWVVRVPMVCDVTTAFPWLPDFLGCTRAILVTSQPAFPWLMIQLGLCHHPGSNGSTVSMIMIKLVLWIKPQPRFQELQELDDKVDKCLFCLPRHMIRSLLVNHIM